MANNMLNRHGQRKAFTLIELMVVVGIIVLLVAILIPVVSKSRNSARAAGTLAQMQHIQQACEHYYTDFNAYPGPVDDRVLAGTTAPTFTGAQNLYLSLCRRFFPANPPSPYVATQPDMTNLSNLWVDQNPGDQLADYSIAKQGSVAVTGEPNAATFDAYLSPKPSEISNGAQSARSNGLDLAKYPAFVDAAFGTEARPILYYRQVYKWDQENATSTNAPANLANTPFAYKITLDQYAAGGAGQACFYANTNTLIDKDGTIPTTTATAPQVPLSNFLTNTIGNVQVPAGGFVLISAGVDRIYGTSDDIIVVGGR